LNRIFQQLLKLDLPNNKYNVQLQNLSPLSLS